MSQKSDLINYYESQSHMIKRIQREFNKSIIDNIFFINLTQLKLESDVILFSNNIWFMRPEQFCLDHYSQSGFSPIIMLVNNIKTIFEFRIEYFPDEVLIAPTTNSIIKLINSIKY